MCNQIIHMIWIYIYSLALGQINGIYGHCIINFFSSAQIYVKKLCTKKKKIRIKYIDIGSGIEGGVQLKWLDLTGRVQGK